MSRIYFLLPVVLVSLGPTVAGEARPSTQSGQTLDAFARQAIATGLPNRVPGPIAGLIDVPSDAPVHQLEVPADQTTDGMTHLFKVTVELSTTTPRRPIGPIGVVLSTYRVEGDRSEHYWFRSSLAGELERSVLIDAKVDEQGKTVKGSGNVSSKDIQSSEIKDRFQHELDLWLRRTHLKKEWRTAEFSGGVLKKRSKRR